MKDTITESEDAGYTPTTEQVRSGYAFDVPDYTNAWEDESRREAFDRWLAKVRADARAEAELKLVAAVESVHSPVDALNVRYQQIQRVCAGCGTDDGNWQQWPCPTLRALNEAMREEQS